MKVLSEYIEDDKTSKVLFDGDRDYFRFTVQMYESNQLVDTRRFTSAGVAEDYAHDWVKGCAQ